MRTRRSSWGVALAALSLAAVTGCSSDTSEAEGDSTPSASTSAAETPGATETSTGSASSDPSSSEATGAPFADQSAEDIVAQARTAMQDVTSLHMVGTVNTQGQLIDIDLRMNTRRECTGTLGIGQGSARIVSVGTVSYVKADPAFFVAGGATPAQARAVLKVVGDKWLRLSGQGAAFTSLCDLDSLLKELVSDDLGDQVEKGELAEIDGQQAIGIQGRGSGRPSVGYVATEGEHYVLRVETVGGAKRNRLDLSEFNQEVTVEAPPPSQVADLDKLRG